MNAITDETKGHDHPLREIVNLTRYPLGEPQSAQLRASVMQCRSDLKASGCGVLPGFFEPGLSSMRRDATRCAPHAYIKERYGNPYSSADDPNLPDNHPVRIFLKRSQGFVAGDQISETSTLKRAYRNPDFRNFVGECLGLGTIHEYADPLGCLVVNVIRGNAEHPWHFDTNEFVVSTVVQAPEAGGEFEYCPNIRSPEQENFERVSRVIRNEDRSAVRALALLPGDIQLFQGRYSLHRVTPVKGARARLSVIFSYSMKPGMIATADRSKHLFGRISDCHEKVSASTGRADTLID